MPRMPDQEMIRPLRTEGRSVGRGGWKPCCRMFHLKMAFCVITQTTRTTITVTSTAPAT